MIEHPAKSAYRDLCIATLVDFDEGIGWYQWGGNDHWKGSDCGGHLVGMLRELGYKPSTWDRSSNGMKQDCVANNDPQVVTFGSLYFYGTSSKVTHVMMAYDEHVAIGANGGSSGTKTLAQAKSRNAGWKFADPNYRSDHQGVYLPVNWYPWWKRTTANLNLRDDAGLAGAVLATMPQGTAVELLSDVIQQADGYTWVGIRTLDGVNGFVASEYLD